MIESRTPPYSTYIMQGVIFSRRMHEITKTHLLSLLFMFANHSESNPADDRISTTHSAISINPGVSAPRYATTLKLNNSSLKHQEIKNITELSNS
jgi:hypothetical protein